MEKHSIQDESECNVLVIGGGAAASRVTPQLFRPQSISELLDGGDDSARLGASWVGAGLVPARLAAHLPLQRIAAPLLAASACPVEAWFSGGVAGGGHAHGVRYRCDGQLLFGVIELDEADYPARPEASPLQQVGRRAYDSVFRLLAEQGYPHVWRVWNYLADINGESHGLERYRQFNVGRHQAFEAAGRLGGDTIPAACALGVAEGPLSVAFLAARAPALPVENPRQLRAYRYPDDYGPCSPTFSRAALARVADEEWLFVSGTASIVGHRTLHPDDPQAQTREIVTNLEALLGEASRLASGPAFRLDELAGRAYVRHPQHLEAVQVELRKALGAAAPIVYVQADVCRADLLVEVEAQVCHALR